MKNRTGNYAAFYVNEPYSQSALGAHASKDFMYYNLLTAWEASDYSFNFVDSHDKTYNVRDGSDWETTLKPRLRERLRYSKNIILFLSSITKSSRALREEIDYGINELGLPVIVVYPDFKHDFQIKGIFSGLNPEIIDLWDNLPIFKNSKYKVPVLHLPLSKDLISSALSDNGFAVGSKRQPGDYTF